MLRINNLFLGATVFNIRTPQFTRAAEKTASNLLQIQMWDFGNRQQLTLPASELDRSRSDFKALRPPSTNWQKNADYL